MVKPPIPSKTNRPPASNFRTPPSTKSYSELPALTQWQNETKIGRVGVRGNDPVLRTIDELMVGLRAEEDGAYLYLLGQLFFTTMSWLNHYKTDVRMEKECRKPILSLNLYAANELANVLECPLGGLAAKLQHIYGVNMSDHGVDTDKNEQDKYFTVAKREMFKVFIILGRACHYRKISKKFMVLSTSEGGKGSLGDYSGEREGFGFVLSMSNELYAGPLEKFGLQYHSYFMGGRPVQCGGTISFSNGVVTQIRNDSGHYKPVDQSMVKLLHYLRMNGMDLRKITVEQEQKFRANEDGMKVRGDIFMANNGNWNSISARAKHQSAI